MSDLARLLVVVALGVNCVATELAAAPPTAADERLLAAADPFARAPESFRVSLEVAAGERTLRLELYRSGDDLALIRFLDPSERGKFLLRHGGETWFLAPGSRRPVRVGPGHRLAGVGLDELAGLRLASTYAVTEVAEASGVVTFTLAARSAEAAFARARHVVRRAGGLPLRTDLQAADGRVLRVLEYPAWRSETPPVPVRVVVKDLVRRGPPVEVRFLDVVGEPLPATLFDPADGAERTRRFGSP
jgi:hypothetical protein